MALTNHSLAATSTWTGGDGFDNYMSVEGNWDVAPVSGDDLVFTGVLNTAVENDLDTSTTGTFEINSITFDADAGDESTWFDIYGNPINFNGKTIINNSAFQHDINAQLEVAGGGMTFGGDGDLYLADIVRTDGGWGATLVKNGNGKVKIGTLNTSYRVELNSGTIDWAETSGNGIAGAVNIYGGTLECNTEGVNPFHWNLPVNMQNSAGTTPATISLPVGEVKWNKLDGAPDSVINNVGMEGDISTLLLRSSNSDFAGSIQDGPGGGKTALILGEPANQTFTFSGPNSFTGDLTVVSSQVFNLTSTGALAFKVEAGGVSNKITGAGTVSLGGTFNINLDDVGTPSPGDTWVLVDSGTLTETYEETFAVAAPFVETSDGSWSYDSGDGVYTFYESTGELGFGRIAVTTWTGGAGSDPSWSNAGNWDQTPESNDLLIFSGTDQTTNNNDLATAFDAGSFVVDGIRFGPGAGAFTLQGNGIDFAGRTIINDSPNLQTIDAELQIDSMVGGLTVNAVAGDVALNSLNLRGGSVASLVKDGSGTLMVNGPLGSSETFDLMLNQGVVEASSTGDLFYDVTVAAGTTLRTGGASATGVLSADSSLTVEGTLDLAEGVVEDIDSLFGGGVVTNHGANGTTSTLALRSSGFNEFSGRISDGPSGGHTSVQVGLAGETETGGLTLTGVNTYTGDTVVGQAEASIALGETGSMTFSPGSNGMSNKVTAIAPQSGGLTDFNGTFLLDLGGAEIADGNSWTLVDVASLNQAYGETFSVLNKDYVPPTTYVVNGGTGVFGDYGDATAYVSGGGDYGNSAEIDLSAVAEMNPAPVEVYQSERYGNSTFTFPGLGAGAGYTVRLHFAEIFHDAVGERVFDVLINGELVLDNYDILAVTGATGAVTIEELSATADLGGNLAIQFVTIVDNAKISGIEIIPDGSGSSANFAPGVDAGMDVWEMVDGLKTWTFSEETGVLSLAVAEGSDYSIWASANGIPGEPPTGDFDLDGIPNIIEYGLAGLVPTMPDGAPGTMVGDTLTFTKRPEAVANGDVSYSIETSVDLGFVELWQAVTPTVNDASTISYTFPGSVPADFARLRVE